MDERVSSYYCGYAKEYRHGPQRKQRIAEAVKLHAVVLVDQQPAETRAVEITPEEAP